MLVFQQILVLFIIMFVGYVCNRIGIINAETENKLSAIVINIANPALILTASMGAKQKVQGTELALTLGIACAMFAALMLVSYLISIILHVDRKKAGVYHVMTIFSNVGFMGFPVVAALYGNDALIYAALFTIPYNLLMYTYGINEMKTQTKKQEKAKLGDIFNIGIIACIITMTIYLLKLPVPTVISSTVGILGNLAAPLSMLVIGASLATIDLKALFADVRLLAFMVLKQLVIPIVGALLIKQLISNQTLIGVFVVMLAMPVGSMTAMLSQQYGGDVELSTKGVALTTLLSVVTIPLVFAIVM